MPPDPVDAAIESATQAVAWGKFLDPLAVDVILTHIVKLRRAHVIMAAKLVEALDVAEVAAHEADWHKT